MSAKVAAEKVRNSGAPYAFSPDEQPRTPGGASCAARRGGSAHRKRRRRSGAASWLCIRKTTRARLRPRPRAGRPGRHGAARIRSLKPSQSFEPRCDSMRISQRGFFRCEVRNLQLEAARKGARREPGRHHRSHCNTAGTRRDRRGASGRPGVEGHRGADVASSPQDASWRPIARSSRELIEIESGERIDEVVATWFAGSALLHHR